MSQNKPKNFVMLFVPWLVYRHFVIFVLYIATNGKLTISVDRMILEKLVVAQLTKEVPSF
jgi:hypothetical protein